MLLYDSIQFESQGQIPCQREDVTALIYVRGHFIVAGQVLGFFDVASIVEGKNSVTHSLQIEQAGDVNCLTQGPNLGDIMVACQ